MGSGVTANTLMLFNPDIGQADENSTVQAYGAQAVVVSIDPGRVYVADPLSTQRPTIRTKQPGPNGEQYCW